VGYIKFSGKYVVLKGCTSMVGRERNESFPISLLRQNHWSDKTTYAHDHVAATSKMPKLPSAYLKMFSTAARA
jgi:hypothetical protein